MKQRAQEQKDARRAEAERQKNWSAPEWREPRPSKAPEEKMRCLAEGRLVEGSKELDYSGTAALRKELALAGRSVPSGGRRLVEAEAHPRNAQKEKLCLAGDGLGNYAIVIGSLCVVSAYFPDSGKELDQFV